MKVLLQRVLSASVSVDGREVSSIEKGLLAFFCAETNDKEEDLARCSRKILNLRIFEDDAGKMNLSVLDIKGEILSISQFTLAASLEKGNRPSFEGALEANLANKFYDLFCHELGGSGIPVKKGIFGAKMKVSLVNDGPVTIIL